MDKELERACSICLTIKPISDFRKVDNYIRKYCLACEKNKKHENYINNRERHFESGRVWRLLHRDEHNESNRIARRTLREEVLDGYGHKCVACGISESEFLDIEHKNNDGKADREKYGTGGKWFKHIIDSGFPDHLQLLCPNHNWKKELKRRRLDMKTDSESITARLFHIKERIFVFFHYGTSCRCCGVADFDILTIDHPNGGGSKHRAEVGLNIYRWLIRNNYPEGYRVLCMNCNYSLGKWKYCPHGKLEPVNA